jgi:hypothetical protein
MLTEFETTLLGIMMIVIMFGMGASLTWRDFLIAFRKPKGRAGGPAVPVRHHAAAGLPAGARRWACRPP